MFKTTNYNEMINTISSVYCLSARHIEKVLEEEIQNNLGSGIESFDFEMMDFKFHIERELIVIDEENEEFEEKWTYERIK